MSARYPANPAAQQYVDGKLCGASDGASYPVVNPATGQEIGRAPAGTAADADRAMDAARRAFDESVKRVAARQLFGAPMADLQMVQGHLADMALSIDAAALLVYRAAWTKDMGAALTPLQIATCGPLIFGWFRASDDNESLEDFLGDGFPIIEALWGVPDATHVMTREVRANWRQSIQVASPRSPNLWLNGKGGVGAGHGCS